MKLDAHNDALVYRFNPVHAKARTEGSVSASLDRRLLASETSFSSELHHAMTKMPHRHLGGGRHLHAASAAGSLGSVTDLQRVIDALLIEF